jgi:hypothetical protein
MLNRIKRRYPTPMALLVVMLGACADDSKSPYDPMPGPDDVPANVVLWPDAPITLDWQDEARALVATHRLSTLAAGRIYAALSVAQNRAVEAVDAGADLTPAGREPGRPATEHSGRSQIEARRGAVAGASRRVLSFFFPGATAALEEMVARQAKAGSPQGHPHFQGGLVHGGIAGDRIIEHVKADGFTTPWTGTVPVGPGMWIPNALPPAGATLGGVKPYFMTSGSQFRSAAPPGLASPAFDADLAEVMTLAQNRTPADVAIVQYWDSPAGTHTPVGVWNDIAVGLVRRHGLDERKATEVFALLQAAMFDSLIGCWDAKYHHWLLRPTHADPAIPLALPLPNFPTYPSGHSCISATAGRVLTHFFPTAANELNGMVEEAGISRIVAGIHFRFDITAGNQLGYAIADLAIARGTP